MTNYPRFFRLHGALALKDILPHFPDKTRFSLARELRACPDLEQRQGKWDVIRHIAGPRYVPAWQDLSYDLYANARLREGAMDYKAMPSRFF